LEIKKVTENIAGKKKGKGECLNNRHTRDLVKKLNHLFKSKAEIPRIRHGKRQTLDTLINEEALLLAKYLRNELEDWNPRIARMA